MARRHSEPHVATSFSGDGHAKMKAFGFSGSLEGGHHAKMAQGGPVLSKAPKAPPAPPPKAPPSGGTDYPTKTPANGGYRMGGAVSKGCYAKGGAVKDADGDYDGDVAQDKAMVKKGIRQHETQEHGGKHSTLKLRRGGHAKKPAKGGALTQASALNRAPRDPETSTTPPNVMPGGVMGYGVQPSSEPDQAGSEQNIPQLKKGGHMKRGRRA